VTKSQTDAHSVALERFNLSFSVPRKNQPERWFLIRKWRCVTCRHLES
jgi:hypothetical protein